jgi:hypothetical protein
MLSCKLNGMFRSHRAIIKYIYYDSHKLLQSTILYYVAHEGRTSERFVIETSFLPLKM